MAKIMFMYSGQGAQAKEMGKELYESYQEVRTIYDRAAKALGKEVGELGFEMEDDELSQTVNAQPAIFVMGLAVTELLRGRGVRPDGYAGFSLGEVTALVAAGRLSESDGYRVISTRAAAMQRAAEAGEGAMYAVLGLDGRSVSEICKKMGGNAWAVNFNSPVQTVVAGNPAECERVCELCIEAGAQRYVRLATNAAFHSPAMTGAALEFRVSLDGIKFSPAGAQMYSNLYGGKMPEVDIPEYLESQMKSPVKWVDEVREMIEDGYDTFIEIGPGKTLCGLIKRIDRTVKTYTSDSVKSVEKIFEELC